MAIMAMGLYHGLEVNVAMLARRRVVMMFDVLILEDISLGAG
jgi:hypothetical protein